jgi:hypothetical protein
MTVKSERTQMRKFGRNVVLTISLLCGFGFMRAGFSVPCAPGDNPGRGAAAVKASQEYQRPGIPGGQVLLLASMEASRPDAGPKHLAHVAAGVTDQDPIVLFLIGVGLATLGIIGLRRVAKLSSRIPPERKCGADEDRNCAAMRDNALE